MCSVGDLFSRQDEYRTLYSSQESVNFSVLGDLQIMKVKQRHGENSVKQWWSRSRASWLTSSYKLTSSVVTFELLLLGLLLLGQLK